MIHLSAHNLSDVNEGEASLSIGASSLLWYCVG
uniref:Uncharacterized protein n=1 Tax=Anguilla anguilla TaxID=7936 RepID=A0A0E9VTN1_ANGAN